MDKSNSVIKTYIDRFPWHAHASDDIQHGLFMFAATDALKKALVQHNQKHSVAWIVYDIDTTTATTDWIDADCPQPNIIAVNPDNGHAHLFYGLETPVHDYSGASSKALRYMGAIDIALTAKLGADPGYSKFISKNPLHDRWSVVVPREELYTLDTLARGLDLGRLMDGRIKQPAIGYGRNCTLFHSLRRWAYSERRKPQEYLSFDMFLSACRWRGLSLNEEFPQPLPHSEVRSVAKSIAKWTWRNMSARGFREWGDKRRARSIATKKARAAELRKSILEAFRECPQLTQSDIAAMLGVHQSTVSRRYQDYARVISDRELDTD